MPPSVHSNIVGDGNNYVGGWGSWLKKFFFFYLVGLGLTLSFRLFAPSPPTELERNNNSALGSDGRPATTFLQKGASMMDIKQGGRSLQQSIARVGAEEIANRMVDQDQKAEQSAVERARAAKKEEHKQRQREESLSVSSPPPPLTTHRPTSKSTSGGSTGIITDEANPDETGRDLGVASTSSSTVTLDEKLEPLEDSFDGYYTAFPPSIFGIEDDETANKNRMQHHNTGGKFLLYNSSCFPQRPLLPDNKTLNPHHCGIMINAVLEAPLDAVSKDLLSAVKDVVLLEINRYEVQDYVRAIPVVVVSHLLFGDSDGPAFGETGGEENTNTADGSSTGTAAPELGPHRYGGQRRELEKYWEKTYEKWPGPMPRPRDNSTMPGLDFGPVVDGYETRVQRRYTLSQLPSYIHFYQLAPPPTTSTKFTSSTTGYNVKKMAAQVAAQPYSLIPLSPFRRTLFANMSVRIGVPSTTNHQDRLRNKMTPPTLVALPLLDHYDLLFIPSAHHDLLLRPLAEYEEDMLRFLSTKTGKGSSAEDNSETGDPVADFLKFVHKGAGTASGGDPGSRLPMLEASTMLEPTFTTTMLFFRNLWDPMGGQREGCLMNTFIAMWKALHIRYLTAENGFLPLGHSSVANVAPTPGPARTVVGEEQVDTTGGKSEGMQEEPQEEGGHSSSNGTRGDSAGDFQEEDLQKVLFAESSTYCARDSSFSAALRESGVRYSVVSETICQDHRFSLPDTCGLIRGRWKDRYLTGRCDGYSGRLGGAG